MHGRRLRFSVREAKAMIAALEYVITNSVKYRVDSNVLFSELEQLGLPNGIIYSQNLNTSLSNE